MVSDKKGVWRTICGRKVFIADGQSLCEAMQTSGKFKKADFDAASGKDTKNFATESDKTTIKQQVQANKDKIAKTKVVAVITKGNMTTDRQTAITALQVRLAKNNGIVERKGFGKVQVGTQIKKSAAYIKNVAEIAAITAVPSVIKHGIEISRHNNHKARGYASVTFAARVLIGDKEGVMAVTVVKTVENRYKMHRVFTSDGNVFEI